jgi:hypothetical protein
MLLLDNFQKQPNFFLLFQTPDYYVHTNCIIKSNTAPRTKVTRSDDIFAERLDIKARRLVIHEASK